MINPEHREKKLLQLDQQVAKKIKIATVTFAVAIVTAFFVIAEILYRLATVLREF